MEWNPYETLAERLTDVLVRYATARRTVGADDRLESTHKSDEIARLQRVADGEAAVVVKEINDLAAAEGSAPPAENQNFEERRYWLERAQQELQNVRPDVALTKFDRILQEGSPVAVEEFARVAESVVAADLNAGVRFRELRRNSMTDDQRARARDEAEVKRLQASVPSLKRNVVQILDHGELADAETRFGKWISSTKAAVQQAGDQAVPESVTT